MDPTRCPKVCGPHQGPYLDHIHYNQWRNRWGGGGGQGGRAPETSEREIFADVSGKKRQEKKGKGVKIEKKRRKIVKGKVENWQWK